MKDVCEKGRGSPGPGSYATEKLNNIAKNLDSKNSLHYNFMSETASTKSTLTIARPTNKTIMIKYFEKSKGSTKSSWFQKEPDLSSSGRIELIHVERPATCTTAAAGAPPLTRFSILDQRINSIQNMSIQEVSKAENDEDTLLPLSSSSKQFYRSRDL